MSCVYFHSPNEEAQVRGCERALAGCLTNDIGLAVLRPNDLWAEDKNRLMAALRHKAELRPKVEPRDLALHFRVDGHSYDITLADGTLANVWDVLLNTSMRLGSRPMRLMTRMHAQCEIHLWVDGPNRAWLADIIEEGRRDGLMRADMGWEAVVTLLRSRADEPVVTSYSVCERFPNAAVAGWKPTEVGGGGEADWDAWYELPDCWDRAMAGLRARGGGLELKPEGFDVFHFGVGVSAIDLMDRLPQP